MSRHAIAIRFAIATALLVGTFIAAPTAQAQPSDRGRDLLRQVIASKDPGALTELSQSDQELVKASFRKELTFVADPAKSSFRKMSAQSAKDAGLTAQAAASSCWSNYQYSSGTLLGITLGHFWMQLNWCSNGSSITSYTADPYGAAGQNGADADAKPAQFLNKGWEVRALGIYVFSTWNGLSSSICAQIRGGATGRYSTRGNDCNLNS